VLALVRRGGRLLNHAISRPPGMSAISDRSFIGRYVFPDGALMEVGKTISAMQAAGFEVRDVESLREHYALTLRAWVSNLEAGWDEAVRLVGPGRARVWLLYMAASAINFEQGRTNIHQVLGVRPHRDGRSDMPLTRRELLGH
jgi:cyclopropane-fatty-acyl-phospholipid synthase